MTVERGRGSGGFWWWMMQRVTGILLFPVLMVHYVVTHLHTSHYVEYDKIAARVATPAWKFLNILFLTIVLLHGLYGVWNVLLDYLSKRPVLRAVLYSIVVTIGLALYVLGLVTIVPFSA
ncbi:MAG: succinate dehydrogenase, hydrophobic membrane anchor protein [Candidatus Eisenbacteria bacterium]|jgi:succinate dehydrogenase / fumarate reductase membrane anchor subunit|nr:succinate dehydrogenase, hydrophobic membrane anchor protein [Candidatus Eisenbacteria bacterium]